MFLIKDPLQIEPSPYEILNIDPSADAARVKKAMGMAIMAKKFKPNQVQAANLILINPQKRGLLDLLMYPVEKVHAVTGSGTSKNLPLELNVREGTAQAWQQQLQEKFPNNVLLHALSVLWYWWANYESARHLAIIHRLDQKGVNTSRITRKDTLLGKIAEAEKCGHSTNSRCPNASCEWYQDCIHNGPGLQEIWEKAIAFNTLMTTMPRIWNELYTLDQNLSEAVADDHRAQLEAELSNLRKSLANTSASALESQLDQLMVDFDTERRTASLMKGVRYYRDKETSYNVGCGRLLMRELNQLKVARGSIDSAVKQNKGSASFLDTCRELQRLLSPFANIAGQIARKRWESALGLIDGLDSTEKGSVEVQHMRTEALIGMGFQELSLTHDNEAIKHWREAKKITGNADLWNEAEVEIEKQVLTRVAKLEQVGKKDDALDLLTQTYEIGIEGPEIKARLASLSYSEAIKIINKVLKGLEDTKAPPSTTDIKNLKKGLALLEKAADMGHPNAAGEAAKVRQIIDQLEGNLKMGPVNDLRQKANDAAKSSNWSSACNYLLTALNQFPSDGPGEMRSEIKKDYATCLTNKAINALNSVLEDFNRGYRDPHKLNTTLNEAKSDLETALILDPNNSHIEEQLKAVCSMLGVPYKEPGFSLSDYFVEPVKVEEPKEREIAGWLINGVVLFMGVLLMFLSVDQTLKSIIAVALFLAAAFINRKPGRGLAWIGVLLGIMSMIIGFFV
jgi:hypothetical protein